jgi:catechol 2,3-dioxygenase-like lactoylglutathione lyase family enzyme
MTGTKVRAAWWGIVLLVVASVGACKGKESEVGEAACPELPPAPPPAPTPECPESPAATACLCPEADAGHATAFLAGADGGAADAPVELPAVPTPQLGYTLLYVADVHRSVEFYERAFALTRKLLDEDGGFATMDTGATQLGFVSVEQARTHLPAGFRTNVPQELPAGFEVALTTSDVAAAYRRAVAAGAVEVTPPTQTPWGQTIAYVRDPDGILVELASPMGDAPPPVAADAG